VQARRGALAASRSLAATGLRATRQRIAVLRVLEEQGGHWTARQVHQRLRRAHAGLSLKTIYLALDAMAAAGLAARVGRGDGPACYEAQRERHWHALCRGCGALHDVPTTAERALRGTALPRGFQTEEIRVVIEGRCARCRSAPTRARRRANAPTRARRRETT
jgi:Fur family ferric uptake transcriptional regulator